MMAHDCEMCSCCQFYFPFLFCLTGLLTVHTLALQMHKCMTSRTNAAYESLFLNGLDCTPHISIVKHHKRCFYHRFLYISRPVGKHGGWEVKQQHFHFVLQSTLPLSKALKPLSATIQMEWEGDMKAQAFQDLSLNTTPIVGLFNTDKTKHHNMFDSVPHDGCDWCVVFLIWLLCFPTAFNLN